MEFESLASRLATLARASPGSPAIIAAGRPTLDRAALDRVIRATAGQLRGDGVRRGDIVATVLPDSPEAATAFLGVSAAAAVAPLNPAYRVAEFEYYFRRLAPVRVVVRAGSDSAAREVAANMGIRVLELRATGDEGVGTFRFAGLPDSPVTGVEQVSADEVALVLHTSGTTSLPKQVPLTHGNLAASVRNLVASLALDESDRVLHVMPMIHVGGLVDTLAAPLASGGAIVDANGYSVEAFYRAFAESSPTWTQLVPPMLREVLEHAERHAEIVARGTFRFVRSVSASLPTPLLAAFESRFGVPVIEIYGMTETAGVITSNPFPHGVRKPGSVGVPIGAEVVAVGVDGHPLAAGTPGEVRVRGASVMRGYGDTGDAPGSGLVDGWLPTGDAGYFDADGYLFLVGRYKEMINRGGEKVLPLEIDNALAEHPAIAEAAAFGVPHPVLGEVVAVAVVARPGTRIDRQEIVAFLSRRLAHFKLPRDVHFVEAIPRSVSGKPQRDRLSAALAPAVERTIVRPPYVAASTPVGVAITRVWEALLGVSPIGADDDVFALGADSLKVASFLNRLDPTGVSDLGVPAVFDAPTPAGQQKLIESAFPALAARLTASGPDGGCARNRIRFEL